MDRARAFRAALAAAGILLAALGVWRHFPPEAQYRTGADEGTYYRHAKTLLEHGWRGYRVVARQYVADKGQHLFPPPFRIAGAAVNAAGLAAHDSMRTLSALSLAAFALLCALTFFAVARLWDGETALVATLLVAASPLAGGMARRALSDSLGGLAGGMALFALLAAIGRPGTRRLALLSAALALFVLVRETAALYFPFFLGALLATGRGPWGERLRGPLLALGAAAAAVLVAYAALLGPENALGSLRVFWEVNAGEPAPYVVRYNSGPWYRYLVDLMLLSPLTLLLALAAAGGFLLGGERDRRTGVLVALCGYSLAVFSQVTMNVRYMMALDLAVRLLAALAVLALARRIGSRPASALAAAGAMVAVLVAADARSFHRHFVRDDTYDPVSHHLLVTEGFVPKPHAATAPDHDQLLGASLELYRAGRHEAAIEAARAALRARPGSAEAWNNICAAYNELGRWDEAIAAGREAVRLAPANQLARNNLAWAIARKGEAAR